MRIVSVLPSATEIVCALGRTGDLVGRSEECNYPPEVLDRPAVMRPKARDFDQPSLQIDERVRATRAKNESLYVMDVELLRQLRPDVLITQDLCKVCSVTGEEVSQACRKAGVAPQILSISPTNLREVAATFRTVGETIGAAEEGRRLEESFLRATAPRTFSSRKVVAVVEWLDPPILAGLWTPELVQAAGGISLRTTPGGRGVHTTWEAIAQSRPDLLVVSPCSFPVERTIRELRDDPKIRASVESVAPPLGTYVADEGYYSRPGPRIAEGSALIHHLLTRSPWSPPMPIAPLEEAILGT